VAKPNPDTIAIPEPEPQPGSTVQEELSRIEAGGQDQPQGSEVSQELARIESEGQTQDPFTAFTQAAKQELDPSYQAFKGAAATQISQMQALARVLGLGNGPHGSRLVSGSTPWNQPSRWLSAQNAR
jgi:hypothetical protein